MSGTDDSPEKQNNPQPGEVPPPLPIMPVPDIIDPRKTGPTYGERPEKSKRSRKEKKRAHPLDPYEPLKKKKGCGGCCGCLGGFVALLALLLVALVVVVVVVGWFGPGRYVMEGYEVVSFEEAETVITTAPDKPTYFIGQKIEYNAPSTDVPIAILGTEITFSGYFGGDLSVSGAKVTGESATTIAGDLEVYAAEFYDAGIQLEGTLKGSVMKNLTP